MEKILTAIGSVIMFCWLLAMLLGFLSLAELLVKALLFKI